MKIRVTTLLLILLLCLTGYNTYQNYCIQDTLSKPFRVEIDMPIIPFDLGPPPSDPCPLDPFEPGSC